jgi:choline kinase
MRYLILLAGMGKRMGPAHARTPKCMVDIDGEPMIARLLRQIRAGDPRADIDVVLGFHADAIRPWVRGCRVMVNPFFDITGITASLWFARASFDQPVMVIHGDVVLADDVAGDLIAAPQPSYVVFDSSVRDPAEINVAVAEGRIIRFGVNFAPFSGAYAGMLRLSAPAARRFADTIDRRVTRGFNEPRTYYFFAMRALIADPDVVLSPFDLAGRRWKEIDRADDVPAARRIVSVPAGAPDAR